MTWLLVTRRPLGPALAHVGLIPRHPYSAVPFPSNWKLWRNFPDAMQQSSAGGAPKCRARRANYSVIIQIVSPGCRPISFLRGTASIIGRWRYAHYDGIVAKAAGAVSARPGGGVRWWW